MKTRNALQFVFAVLATLSCFMLLTQAPEGTAQAAGYLSFKTEDEANNIEIFKKASPSVVYVTNTALRQRDFFSRNLMEIPQGSGSGFVWDKSGLVVTNFHVIQGANRITITLQDQSSWDAEVVGLAEDKDLALLKIDAPADKLTPLPLGDSGSLEVGRKVIAIGNPFGLDTTLTVGVVSALGREINSLTNRKIRDVIQTDASINPGNSGGPLLNSMGQLIGVNTQILSPSGASAGIGFAIPVNTVKKIIPQLVTYGREVRPILGVENVPDNYSRQWGIEGVPIGRVLDDLPAEEAGLTGLRQDVRGGIILGDIIIELEGNPIANEDDLLNALEQFKPGDTVTVTTQRNQQLMEFEVELADPVQGR
ncbi:MAG: trypsin-like peptidase domain-containing protein [Pseudohongiellaceae bacterium]